MTFLVHAPGLGRNTIDSMAVLGAGMWLGIQAKRVKSLRLEQCKQVFLDPQLANCFVLIASETTQGYTPVLWLSYANFNANAEADYVAYPDRAISQQSWNAGDRLWFLHLIAQGQISLPVKSVLREIFAHKTARFLSPRSCFSGQKVMLLRGNAIDQQAVRAFWKARPILAHQSLGVRHE
jgi:cytolysin-activating lysine-acyltransferase